MPQFVDEFASPGIEDASVETFVTLAQGLKNGKHRLEIEGSSKTPIAAIRVYRPLTYKAGRKTKAIDRQQNRF